MERELVALRGIIEQVGAAPRVIAFVQLNGLEAPAAIMLLWMAPYPPFASTR
jgi:hypothetical protein